MLTVQSEEEMHLELVRYPTWTSSNYESLALFSITTYTSYSLFKRYYQTGLNLSEPDAELLSIASTTLVNLILCVTLNTIKDHPGRKMDQEAGLIGVGFSISLIRIPQLIKAHRKENRYSEKKHLQIKPEIVYNKAELI